MGGKGSAPAAPNYQPIASADTAIANQQFQLGQQQLGWAQNQFNTVWPYAQNYLNSQTAATTAEQGSAQAQQQFYNSTYKPIETQFANQASTWNSPARADANAGAAEADAANTFNQQRTASLQNLESFGIDPSQTRYGALDLGSRITQAAATAAAGTQSRLNTQATGLALEGEAINIGRGYPGSIAQSYNTATNSGSSALSSANSTINTGSNAMLGSNSFTNSGLNANAGAVSALNTGFNNQMSGYNANQQANSNLMGGIGSLAGMGIAAMMM